MNLAKSSKKGTQVADSKNIFKEPLLHFLLIGAALFVVFDVLGRPASFRGGQQGSSAAQIIVSRDAVERATAQYERTWQRQTTEEEQKSLIEDLVRSEIYYREAIAIGLDRDDEVLKRRLRQKMEFIFEDISSWADPSDGELTAFMKSHRERYLSDPRIAFRQIFFSRDRRGTDAEADAGQALAQLAAGADPETAGYPTLLPREVRLSELRDIGNQFGDGFARNVLALRPGVWAGPVNSAYGLHIVFVSERQDPRLPDLSRVREMVKRDWLAGKQQELKDAAYARLRQRYVVTVEQPKDPASTLSAAVQRPERIR